MSGGPVVELGDGGVVHLHRATRPVLSGHKTPAHHLAGLRVRSHRRHATGPPGFQQVPNGHQRLLVHPEKLLNRNELLLDGGQPPIGVPPGFEDGIGLTPEGVLNGQIQPRQLFKSLPLLGHQSPDLILNVTDVPLGGAPGEGQP